MLGPVSEKLVILGGMFVATLVFAMLPFRLVGTRRLSSKWRTSVSFASCYSGGVFIAACLLDLFPDVHEAMDHVLDEIEARYSTKIDYPVSEFVICLGFFLVLIVEQIVLDCRENWTSSSPAERAPLLINSDQMTSSSYGSTNETASLSGISTGDHHDGHDHDHVEGIFQHSTLRSVLLLVALSFHSVFEGLAIGLQQDLGQLISLFLAVIAHKAIMAFSLGLTLAQATLNAKQYVLSVTIFSVASPLGMGIGILLADMEKSLGGDIANSILQGMAGGTFLYITFFEVLPHELNQPRHRMLKLVFVLLGFGSICGLLFITH